MQYDVDHLCTEWQLQQVQAHQFLIVWKKWINNGTSDYISKLQPEVKDTKITICHHSTYKNIITYQWPCILN